MKLQISMAAYLLLFLSLSIEAMETPLFTHVIYPKPDSENDHREDYRFELLNHALQLTSNEYGAFDLQYSREKIPDRRLDLMLMKKQEINIFSSATSQSLESDLQPIRVPILKGMLGLRLLFIRANKQQTFEQGLNNAELRQFHIGQGLGWPDVQIYQYNGFDVTTTADYQSLFFMLKKGRFDMFPRGVNEIFQEYAMFSKQYPDLAIEKNYLFYYPLPVYFFVSKKDVQLASRIEKGLDLMKRDGSFDQMFDRYHAQDLARLNFKTRRLFVLKNPLLPDNVNFDRADYWLKELYLIHRSLKTH